MKVARPAPWKHSCFTEWIQETARLAGGASNGWHMMAHDGIWSWILCFDPLLGAIVASRREVDVRPLAFVDSAV